MIIKKNYNSYSNTLFITNKSCRVGERGGGGGGGGGLGWAVDGGMGRGRRNGDGDGGRRLLDRSEEVT